MHVHVACGYQRHAGELRDLLQTVQHHVIIQPQQQFHNQPDMGAK